VAISGGKCALLHTVLAQVRAFCSDAGKWAKQHWGHNMQPNAKLTSRVSVPREPSSSHWMLPAQVAMALIVVVLLTLSRMPPWKYFYQAMQA
jgi:hypothetical protein